MLLNTEIYSYHGRKSQSLKAAIYPAIRRMLHLEFLMIMRSPPIRHWRFEASHIGYAEITIPLLRCPPGKLSLIVFRPGFRPLMLVAKQRVVRRQPQSCLNTWQWIISLIDIILATNAQGNGPGVELIRISSWKWRI